MDLERMARQRVGIVPRVLMPRFRHEGLFRCPIALAIIVIAPVIIVIALVFIVIALAITIIDVVLRRLDQGRQTPRARADARQEQRLCSDSAP
jgi:hypothetical protein